ncbi:hypothetical protein GDO81_019991 [Engystomops pustulosus]|uniref:Secreted protein n=1 Tax=Engystomops pustulosus TaxID=76066 RepID=A0AAV6Z0Z1_ENGPU|nr:hypothetical protein GDO81_019991 [Engystomops pustulosus]
MVQAASAVKAARRLVIITADYWVLIVLESLGQTPPITHGRPRGLITENFTSDSAIRPAMEERSLSHVKHTNDTLQILLIFFHLFPETDVPLGASTSLFVFSSSHGPERLLNERWDFHNLFRFHSRFFPTGTHPSP